jgi:non-canonical purine NTP pyrophosphatase, rdgB/HAM1 family
LNNLLFFSLNKKKITEVEKIFNNKKIKIHNLISYNKIKEPNENGLSFAENAKIKSSFGLNKFNIPCFADDSGLCVEAIKNKPGIKSRRFLEKFKSNYHAFEYIISNVIKAKNDKAFFKTAICLSIKKNYHIVFEGRIMGRISLKPKGVGGFGYDPIFIPEGYKKTFAEMKLKEKNKISHRKIALTKMESFLFN